MIFQLGVNSIIICKPQNGSGGVLELTGLIAVNLPCQPTPSVSPPHQCSFDSFGQKVKTKIILLW